MRAIARAAVAVGVLYAAASIWAELVHWRASRRGLDTARHADGDAIVLVLGYRNRGDRANFINRWRVRAGLRSARYDGGSSTIVFSGGAVGGARSEASLMAAYARTVRGYRGRIVTESASRTTWENIRNVTPLLESADRIAIVSNPLHAEKAREYLRRQRPDLAGRLVRAADYRFGEMFLLKPILAVVSLRKVAAHDREMHSPPAAVGC
jgi:uncharacterized SAM-binding protein YcdF (DUF218 family)